MQTKLYAQRANPFYSTHIERIPEFSVYIFSTYSFRESKIKGKIPFLFTKATRFSVFQDIAIPTAPTNVASSATYFLYLRLFFNTRMPLCPHFFELFTQWWMRVLVIPLLQSFVNCSDCSQITYLLTKTQ